MPILIPLCDQGDEVAVTSSSAQFATLTMDTAVPSGLRVYRFVASTSCWLATGANPTASAAAGSLYVPANTALLLDGAINGAKVAVIRDAADGKASLTPMLRVL